MKKLLPLLFFFLAITAFGQNIRNMADSTRKRRGVPALAYAVFNTDSIFNMGAVGYTKFATKDTVRINDRFHIGSNTSTLTTMIAAQLVEKGKIKWNTTIIQLFPELSKKIYKGYENLMLVDFLSQRAGLPPFIIYNELFTVPMFPGSSVEKRKTFVGWVLEKNQSRDAAAAKKYSFSNAQTAIATAMLEKASGKSWETLLQEFINKPLGISVKIGWPNRIDVRQPWGHWIEADRFIATPPDYWLGYNPVFTGASDANITMADYIKFIQDQLRGLTGRKALLPKRAYELMHYSYADFGVGWTNLEVQQQHISESDGFSGTFFSHVEIFKEANLGIIVMANSCDNNAKGAVLNLAKLIRKQYLK